MNQTVAEVLCKGGEHRLRRPAFRTTPRFETRDRRYAWLNQSIFVAEGRVGPATSSTGVPRGLIPDPFNTVGNI